MTRDGNRAGFTLAEAMIATVVLGIAAAGVILPFVGGAEARTEGSRRTLAAKLAGDLVEQIVRTPFDQIIAAYNGYAEAQGQVKDAAGVVFADKNYARFSKSATCQSVYVPQESGKAQPIFIRVTVQVRFGAELMATVNRLVSK